ncbi:hypothetical protein [Sphingomonas sp. Leaf23]|uniref:hypothetical protein n=1 Tax=Sphingomonas sp. Leaf23 TaxID=1735689 RepID=UPI000A9D66D3|nr:hypothetical protein [Sphingomonas sp. Leaf23]
MQQQMLMLRLQPLSPLARTCSDHQITPEHLELMAKAMLDAAIELRAKEAGVCGHA